MKSFSNIRTLWFIAIVLFAPQHAFAREPWSDSSVYTVPAKRWEFGLLQNAHYGINRHVEIALHPLLTFVLPHLELKATALELAPRASRTPLALGVKARISDPTGFLALVSREGSGGLLPKTSKPPFAIQIEGDIGATFTVAPKQRLSAWLGLAVAPHAHFAPEQLPLLDFPFLYPRFAPLYTPLVPRAELDAEGPLLARIYYHAALTAYLLPQLPDVGTAYAIEPALTLEYRSSQHFAVSLGARTSYAKYPVGTRFHYLPFADVRFGF